LPVDEDVSLGRLDEAHEHVKGRRLPGPVGTQKPDDLSRADVQVDPVDDSPVAELLDQPFRRKREDAVLFLPFGMVEDAGRNGKRLLLCERGFEDFRGRLVRRGRSGAAWRRAFPGWNGGRALRAERTESRIAEAVRARTIHDACEQ
jgi:hypothetical protein